MEVNEARNRHPHEPFEEHAQLLASTILHLASHITQFAQGLQSSSLVGRKSAGSTLPHKTGQREKPRRLCLTGWAYLLQLYDRVTTTPAIYKVQSQAKKTISVREIPGKEGRKKEKKNAGEGSPHHFLMRFDLRTLGLGRGKREKKISQRQCVTGVWRAAVPPRRTFWLAWCYKPQHSSLSLRKQMHWKGTFLFRRAVVTSPCVEAHRSS